MKRTLRLQHLSKYVGLKITIIYITQCKFCVNKPSSYKTSVFGGAIVPNNNHENYYLVEEKIIGWADFLKFNFFCTTKSFVGKLCANKIGQKTPKKLQKSPKKENGDKLCIFMFKNPSHAQSLENVARPYSCTF